ncbi:hypothetical protein BJV82DRAFT_524451 [Fennellomyces sp. T-0311]|nr:hypothetical protein BJV82DRAFT_524451 [Fennellomyces sp. T-0311]
MDRDKMWVLRSGKVVEDALFHHALLLDSERLCHSFIIDMTNNDLVKQDVFTQIEWQEILEENRKPNPDLPKTLKAYMNGLNSDSFSSLRSKLYERHAWQVDYDHAAHSDFDWVHSTMLNMVRLLQSKNLAYNHLESWYNAHVWRFVDTVFDDNDDVTVVRGESSSKASTVRRNEGRQDVAVRQKMGARLDLVIRTKHADHSKNIELGGGECGKNHEDATGTKRLNEAKLKLPKSLKDMVNDILSVYPALKNDIETFGFATYGKSLE